MTNTPTLPNEQDASKKRRAYRRPGLTTKNGEFVVPDALTHFDKLPDSAYVGQPVVEGLHACSPATVWRRVKQGAIPAPKKFGRRTVWNVGELRQALAK